MILCRRAQVWTFSTPTSKFPLFQVLFLTRTSFRNLGHSGVVPILTHLLISVTYRHAQGHHLASSHACLRALLIWVFMAFTVFSTLPFPLGSSPGVRVMWMPRELAHRLNSPENSRPLSQWIRGALCPSAFSFKRNSIFVLVTSLAVFVTI